MNTPIQRFQSIYFKVARTCNTRNYEVDIHWSQHQFMREMQENIRRDFNIENFELVDACEQFPPNVASEDKYAFVAGNNQSLKQRFMNRNLPSFYIRPITENVAIDINDNIDQVVVVEQVVQQDIHTTPGLTVAYVPTCVVCLTNERTILVTPCNHLCLCTTCSSHTSLHACPLCRTEIGSRITVFV